MKLTPGQISELRGDKNVRGSVLAGVIPVPLYLVSVQYLTFERAQILTNAKAMPPGMVWYLASANPTRVQLHTTQPEWFVELEDRIEDARRPT